MAYQRSSPPFGLSSRVATQPIGGRIEAVRRGRQPVRRLRDGLRRAERRPGCPHRPSRGARNCVGRGVHLRHRRLRLRRPCAVVVAERGYDGRARVTNSAGSRLVGDVCLCRRLLYCRKHSTSGGRHDRSLEGRWRPRVRERDVIRGSRSLEERQFALSLDEALAYADTDLSKVASFGRP